MKRPLLVVGPLLVLYLLAVAPASAQGPTPEERLQTLLSQVGVAQFHVCGPGYCYYVTNEDNLGNGGVDTADNDMGWNRPLYDAIYRTCQADAKHPIELAIEVWDKPFNTDATLTLNVLDTGIRWRDIQLVELNGQSWEPETERFNTNPDGRSWVTYEGHIEPGQVRVDPSVNLVTLYLKSGRCIQLGGSFIFMTDYHIDLGEEFVPEPGSIILMGSGLAGLAGYAASRWRMRG